MESTRWEKIQQIVLTALELPLEKRSVYLDTVCGHDIVLRDEVNELLAVDDVKSVLDEESVFALASFSTDDGLPQMTTESKSPIESLVGKVLDSRYAITSQIGEGGMGYVFKAQDKKLTNRSVVVKLLKPETLQHEYLIVKFQQEMEALARIKADGVIDVYDIGTLDETPYIVTEYFEGASLDQRIPPTGMSFSDVAEVIKKVGRTLSVVHQAGIIHRDLKPSNILIRNYANEIQVKVIDFGIARITDSVVSPQTTQIGRTLGTVYYMSPEQLYGVGKLTPASDVFSLGIIAYEMLIGKRPFEPTSIVQLSEMHRQGVQVLPRELRPEIPARTQEIILKALSYAPEARYQDASEFGDELAESLKQIETSLNAQSRSADEMKTTFNTGVVSSALIEGKNFIKTTKDEHLILTTPGSILIENKSANVISENATQNTKGNKTIALFAITAALVLLILGAGAAAAVWLVFPFKEADVVKEADAPLASREDLLPSQEASRREFTYSLLVQPTEKNREPFAASPVQTFLSGWRFKLQFISPQDGYLYLLSEGLNKTGESSLTILFPDPRQNNGTARVSANETVTTNQFEFANTPGVEKFWILWSEKALPEFEAVKNLVNPKDLGSIREQEKMRAIKNFLQTNVKKVQEEENVAQKSVLVEGDGDVIIKLAELRHN